MKPNSAKLPDLGTEVERLLEGWPVAERTDDQWEAMAQSTLARIANHPQGTSSEGDLLEAPLPRVEDEPETFTASGMPQETDPSGAETEPEDADETEPEILDAPPGQGEQASAAEDEPGLAAIARAALGEDDSADALSRMAQESLSIASQSRRRGLATARARGPEGDAAPAAVEATDAPASTGARSTAPGPASDRSKMFFAFGVGALSMAAVVLLYIAQRDAPPETRVATAEAPRSAAAREPEPAPVTEADEAPAAQGEEAKKETPASQEPPVVALDDLEADEVPSPRKAVARAEPAKSPVVSLARRAEKDEKGAANSIPELSQTQSTETEKLAEAPGKPEEPMQPAAQDTELRTKPSVGELQGAVATVMTNARTCIAGQEEPSKATITFGPKGRVQSVGVSGPASGTAAESCIRAALGAARVGPFSDPKVSVSITVRP